MVDLYEPPRVAAPLPLPSPRLREEREDRNEADDGDPGSVITPPDGPAARQARAEPEAVVAEPDRPAEPVASRPGRAARERSGQLITHMRGSLVAARWLGAVPLIAGTSTATLAATTEGADILLALIGLGILFVGPILVLIGVSALASHVRAGLELQLLDPSRTWRPGPAVAAACLLASNVPAAWICLRIGRDAVPYC